MIRSIASNCNDFTPFSQESNASYSSRSHSSHNSNPIINLCSSDEEIKTKVTSKIFSSRKPSKTPNVFERRMNTTLTTKDLNLDVIATWETWTDLVPSETASDHLKRDILIHVTKLLTEKAQKRHLRNKRSKGKRKGNCYLQATVALVKAAYQFEMVPNLMGNLKNTYFNIGVHTEDLIQDIVSVNGGSSLWLSAEENVINDDLCRFIEARAKAEFSKPILTFLKENQSAMITELVDVCDIFNHNHETQMFVSAYWYMRHSVVVPWKEW
jgi:hypothetical protein